MSQFPAPHFSPPDDQSGAPRRLISPQERFAASETEPPTEPENPFEAQISARRRDEMERRHLPPRERARQERARLKLENVSRESSSQNSNVENAPRRRAAPSSSHQQRARAERHFTQNARETAPLGVAKRRRVPKWLKRLSGLVALILLGLIGYAAFTAPQFGIASVDIRGIAATPQDELRPLARRLIGQNVLRFQGEEVARAARLLPTVESAQVVRLAQWPPKVALQISERAPVLKVGAGRDWWVVDPKGVPFRRSNPGDAALYRVVAPQFAPELGRPLDPKLWARARALTTAIETDNRFASAATQSENARFWQLRRIYFDRDGLASLRFDRAPHRETLVRLGDDAWPAKLARARQSLAYFERTGRKASELDLVSLERPVWTQRIVQTTAKPAPDAG